MLLLFQDISPDAKVQIAAIIAATITFITAQAIERSRDRKIARREIYQNLELASISLFRFEADHLELIRPVWEEGKPLPAEGTAEFTATSNYVCQILNLFELAIKFRKDKTMPPDIFGSWVAWFYQLLNAPGFPAIWHDTKWNYLPTLREIMDGGLGIIAIEHDPVIRKDRFYQFISHYLKCHIIRGWGESTENNPLDEFWKSGLRTKKTRPMSDAKQISVQWLSDPSQATDLARLFIENSGRQYISHGELQDGRAISQKKWSPNLENHLIEEFQQALGQAPLDRSNIIAARQHDAIVGFILMEYGQSPAGPFATMSDIIVDKSYRNIKVGEKMILWACEQLKAKQINILYAESNVSNELAHAFLLKMGFEVISKVFRKEIN